MSSATPEPRPQVSPDGFKYWDGSDWRQMPSKVCEWDGFEWKAKPSGIETEWNGKEWIAKPLGVESLWNGTEWAVKPQGESRFDGERYVPKPDGVEAEWDGKSWQVRPQGRVYWTGSRWQHGRRPIIKFGISVLALVVLAGLIFGGLLLKSAYDEQSAAKAKEQEVASSNAKALAAAKAAAKAKEREAVWSNAKALATAKAFTSSINATNADCYNYAIMYGTKPDACLRSKWEYAIPANAYKDMQVQVDDPSPEGILGADDLDSFNLTDSLGNTYVVCSQSPRFGDGTLDYYHMWVLKKGSSCDSASPVPSSG